MQAGSIQTRLLGILAIGISCSVIACSGGGGASTPAAAQAPPPQSGISVSITPPSPDVPVSTGLPLGATVSGVESPDIVWSVDNVAGGNAAVGTIIGSGTSVTYLAPDSSGTHVLSAALRTDTNKKGSTTVRVTAPVVVTLNPANATLTVAGTQSFTATVTGSTNTGVTWMVDDLTNGSATVGLITGSGSTVTYTAPASAGTHTVKAVSTADVAKSDSSIVTVQAAPVVTVGLAPATSSLAGGGTQAFTATVSGSANTAVTWKVDGVSGGNSTVGTITGTGNSVTYTAPAGSGSHTVLATSVADVSKQSSASVTVNSSCAPAPTSSQIFNVKDTAYGALGNGSADDTAALQRAINAANGTGGTVYVPAGTYMINALTSLSLKSNMTFSMATGAVLKAITNSSGNYAILRVSSASNVNILGGTILGERSTHTGTTGEWGHGIVLNNAQHVVIEGVTAKDCWGDGFDVAFSADVTMCNVVADHNRRQGMSITSVNGMVVRNSTFKNTTGTLPEDGIDIEPNVGETVNNVLITGCTLSGNAGFGLEIGVPLTYSGQAWITGVVADGNICNGNGVNTLSTSGRAGIEASDTSGPGHQITNNTCSGNYGYGILLRNSANGFLIRGNTASSNTGDGIQQYLCADNTVTGNTVTGNGGHGIYSPNCTGGSVSGNTVSGNALVP